MKITYILQDKVSYRELQVLFKEMDSTKGERFWARDIFHYSWRTKKQELIALKKSTFITARINNKLVGLTRLVDDGAYDFYVAEVMVIPYLQGRGIGKKIMNKTINYCKKRGFLKIFISALPGKETYYQQFGFKPAISQVMEIKFKDTKHD
jgi:N-acetylglutamate synthase-like GNAT family acetyltransferase